MAFPLLVVLEEAGNNDEAKFSIREWLDPCTQDNPDLPAEIVIDQKRYILRLNVFGAAFERLLGDALTVSIDMRSARYASDESHRVKYCGGRGRAVVL